MAAWIFANSIRPTILLILISVCVWIMSIHGAYITIDTPWLVVSNPILQTSSISTIQTIWTDLSIGTRLTLGAEYLPVRDMTVLLDFTLFGHDLRWHHAHSLFWYMLSCGLLWHCSQIIFGRYLWTWLGCLIFALHPTHVESVVWLASRKDVVSLALGLFGVLLYLRQHSMIAISGVLLLSYWAKNTAVVFAPMLVLLSILHHQEKPNQLTWWMQWIPVVLVYCCGLILTMKVGSMVAMFASPRGDTALDTLNIAVQTWTRYAGMLTWPTKLSIFYAEPMVDSWMSPAALIGVILGLGTMIAPLFWMLRAPQLSLAIWMLPLGLLPVSQITPIQNLMADRYLLIPSIGLSWVIAYIGQQRELHWRWSMPILLLFGWHTIDRIPVFHKMEVLWQDVIQKEPREIRAWISLIAWYRETDQIESARELLHRAELQFSNRAEIYLSKGLLYQQEGNTIQAIQALDKAWQIDTNLRTAAYNLAMLQNEQNPVQALEISNELTTIHPLYPNGWSALGNACLKLETWDCAEKAFTKAHELEPYNQTHLINLGSTHYLQGNWAQSIEYWTQANELAPDNQYVKKGLNAARQQLR